MTISVVGCSSAQSEVDGTAEVESASAAVEGTCEAIAQLARAQGRVQGGGGPSGAADAAGGANEDVQAHDTSCTGDNYSGDLAVARDECVAKCRSRGHGTSKGLHCCARVELPSGSRWTYSKCDCTEIEASSRLTEEQSEPTLIVQGWR